MKTLEEKILEAKAVGLKFHLCRIAQGIPPAGIGILNVDQTWTNDEFEKALDFAVKRMQSPSYLTILKKHNLLA